MKNLLILLLLLSSIVGISQVKVEISYKNGISYLNVIDSTNHPFFTKLKNNYGYRSSLLNRFFFDSIDTDLSKMSDDELLQIINEEKGTFSCIDYEQAAHFGPFFQFECITTDECINKKSNSVSSNYPVTKPTIIDLIKKEKITDLSQLLSEKGISKVKELILKEYAIRGKYFCNTEERESCRIGHYGICDLTEENLEISNLESTLDAGYVCHYFTFSDNYLQLTSNRLELQSLLCLDPDARILIPWYDLKDDLRAEYRNCFLKRFDEVGEVDAYYTIKSPFLNLLPIPYEHDDPEILKCKFSPYVVKGDQIKILYELNEWLRVEYTSKNNRKYGGWVKADQLN